VIASSSSTVSDIVLPAAGILVALLVGILGAWVAYAVGFPQRRLFYGLPVVTPLLATQQGVAGDVELRHRGTVLSHPYVLEVQLIARGRKDIPSSSFDSGKPIRIDVGARIVEVLQSTSVPDSIAPPRLVTDGTEIKVGPSLIGKRQKISIALLADGEHPHLTFQGSLENVTVRPSPEQSTPIRPWLSGLALGVTAATVGTAIYWAVVASGSSMGLFFPISPTTKASNVLRGLTVGFGVSALVLWLINWGLPKRVNDQVTRLVTVTANGNGR
jgi:hypothetical protein